MNRGEQGISDTGTPYADLSPDTVLCALESAGFSPDGSMLALNSYENRVYQIGIEGPPLVAKFYRPLRWSDAAILEEHAFSLSLAKEEIPVVARWSHQPVKRCTRYQGYRFSLFPRQGGRWPEFDNLDNLTLDRPFSRPYPSVGNNRKFAHRPSMNRKRSAANRPLFFYRTVSSLWN